MIEFFVEHLAIVKAKYFCKMQNCFPLWNADLAEQKAVFVETATGLQKLMTPFIDHLLSSPESLVRILSIGCRDSEELICILAAFMDERRNPFQKRFEFVGIDIDAVTVQTSKILFENLLMTRHGTINFIATDAHDVWNYNTIPFKGIIMRHPRMRGFSDQEKHEAEKIGQFITDKLPQFFTSETSLFVSFYHPHEKEKFEQLFTPQMSLAKSCNMNNTSGSYTYISPFPRGGELIFDQYVFTAFY